MKEIKKYLETRIGKYSFFFEDLESGFTYGYNEHEKANIYDSIYQAKISEMDAKKKMSDAKEALKAD